MVFFITHLGEEALLVAAEMVAASVGVGQMALNASNFLRTDIVVMGIIVIGVVAYLFDLLMRFIERRLGALEGADVGTTYTDTSITGTFVVLGAIFEGQVAIEIITSQINAGRHCKVIKEILNKLRHESVVVWHTFLRPFKGLAIKKEDTPLGRTQFFPRDTFCPAHTGVGKLFLLLTVFILAAFDLRDA